VIVSGTPLQSKPGELDITEVAQVDYIIAYSRKGNATLKEEMTQTRNLVMHSSELTGCQSDVQPRMQVLNSSTTPYISKQEATVMFAFLPFTFIQLTQLKVVCHQQRALELETVTQSTLIVPRYKQRLGVNTKSQGTNS
jgi:hypothetical protein